MKNKTTDGKDLQKKLQNQIQMNFSDHEMHENAFIKGIREIAADDRRKAAKARMEIRTVLGGIKKAQFYNRRGGGVKHTPAERTAIEKVFRKYKVNGPWGL